MRTFNRIKSFSLVFYAEVGRTFQERITYRTQLVLGLLTGIVGLAQFAILGYYISLGGTPPGLEQYGGNIIAFMIVGSLFSALAVMMMNSLKMQIQSEQKRGTLEAIALSRAGLFKFLIAGGVFGLVMTLISSVAIFRHLWPPIRLRAQTQPDWPRRIGRVHGGVHVGNWTVRGRLYLGVQAGRTRDLGGNDTADPVFWGYVSDLCFPRRGGIRR